MRILVFGASGQTGSEFVRQAVQRQHAVTAFSRQPSKMASLESAIRLVEGNVNDAEAVSSSVRGQDAVVSFLGVSKPLSPDPDVVTGIGHIVGAMQALDVRRFIYMSFIGVSESRNAVGFVLRRVAPVPLRHEIADHEAKEALVRQSTLDWTIVRPPKLTNGVLTGQYRTGERIRTWHPLPLLSRADVAHFVLGELDEPQHIRRCPRLLH